MKAQSSRRTFVKQMALGGLGLLILRESKSAWSYQANDKLNIAFVGAGGRGGDLVDEFGKLGENIVALCDVDEQMASGSFKKFPNAKRYHDFRKMLEEMHREIDAVVVSTTDHTHAVASVMAMKLGKHVYCEKPLTYCVYEARVMREVSKQYKVATQMGNQGMGSDWSRQVIEIIQSGAIGKVREVHLWTDRPIWPQGIERPKEEHPVPPHLKWDLWIGPAPYRPYHPAYHPFRWRGWIDFGTGALGDIGCHVFPLPFLALKLKYPTWVQAISPGHNNETFPKWSIVQYDFPARGDLPPVRLTWYDGGQKPSSDLLRDLVKDTPIGGGGSLFIGDKGVMLDGRLLPAENFKDYQPPTPTLPRAPQGNHYLEWVIACKTGQPTMSNFDFAGLVTEVVLLGNVALLTEQKIEFNPVTMTAKGFPEADPLIRREYRQGWSL